MEEDYFDEEYGDDTRFSEPAWVTEARSDVVQLLETLELNPVTNEAGLVIPIRHKRDPVTWFSSLVEMHAKLTALAESVAASNAPFEGGESVFGDFDATNLIDGLLEESGVASFFQSLREPDETASKLFLPAHYATPEAGAVFRVDIADINAELVAHLARNPAKMYELSPRKFEELVAELLRDKGYSVELTPSSGDGGRDVICTQKSMLGTMLIYVECKRFGPTNPVGVGIVRSLYGVVEADGVTHGVIATTSRFTRGAIDFHTRNKHRLSLQDFDALSRWLSDYRLK